MFSSRTRRLTLLSWVPLALFVFCGCTSTHQQLQEPERQDDFGNEIDQEPITPESVGATMMLHRRARVEPSLGLMVPMEGHFDMGPIAGVRGEIESLKNVFWGVSFDWSHNNVSDPAGVFNTQVDPAQYYESLDRYNLLITLTYDLQVKREFLVDDCPLSLRLGLGLGSLIVDGKTAPGIQDGGFTVEQFIGFLGEASLDAHWQIWDYGRVLLGMSYQYVYPGTLEVRQSNGDIVKVSPGGVNYDAFVLRAGFLFEF